MCRKTVLGVFIADWEDAHFQTGCLGLIPPTVSGAELP